MTALVFTPAAGAALDGEVFRRGDANGDGTVNIADAIHVLSALFGGGALPACSDAADGNDDGVVDIADAVAVLGFLFGGREPLPPPFPQCGPDPTPDSLACDTYPSCPPPDRR